MGRSESALARHDRVRGGRGLLQQRSTAAIRAAVELKADTGGGAAVSKAARREAAEVGQGRARG
jgi:hypothetical protein